MPETLPVPGSGSTRDAPSQIPYSGAPVPLPSVLAHYATDDTAITILPGAAARIELRLAGATALTDLTFTAVAADLLLVDVTLPAALDTVTFGADCAAGDWPDAVIAALPDRSGDDDGEYTDTETILTAGQIAALEAKGFFSA
ncbi:MAG TPA: hypothetical protein DEA90_16240 [Opitutae bacterium]|nr:hypothetical protein [Puniceicoccaceae bacterium]HBR95707.1 hypothetical protein [Opitutae bacterium]|tara:strand:- start:12675 stop:13103 length:429 start_codon:yes stop_codon:yes gene_type:complete